MRIVTVEEMRQIEQSADAGGLSYDTMMENAGRAIASAIAGWRAVEGRRVLILIGPGNNGGDGLVAAHYLHAMGADVACYVWKRRANNDKNIDRVVEDEGLSTTAAELGRVQKADSELWAPAVKASGFTPEQ